MPFSIILTTCPASISSRPRNPFLKHFRGQRGRSQMLTKDIVEIATNASLLAFANGQNVALELFTGGDLSGEITCSFANSSFQSVMETFPAHQEPDHNQIEEKLDQDVPNEEKPRIDSLAGQQVTRVKGENAQDGDETGITPAHPPSRKNDWKQVENREREPETCRVISNSHKRQKEESRRDGS